MQNNVDTQETNGMSKASFLDYFMNQDIKYEPLMEAKYVVMSMLGLRSDGTPEEEFKAI